MSIAWAIPLVFALQEANVEYEWKSNIIIGSLVVAIAGFITFGFYEAWVERKGKLEPMFPMKFVRNALLMLIFL